MRLQCCWLVIGHGVLSVAGWHRPPPPPAPAPGDPGNANSSSTITSSVTTSSTTTLTAAQTTTTGSGSTGGGTTGSGNANCHQLVLTGPGASSVLSKSPLCIPDNTNPAFQVGAARGTTIEFKTGPSGGQDTPEGRNYLDISVCAGYTAPVQCSISGSAINGMTSVGGTQSFGSCPNEPGSAAMAEGACQNYQSNSTTNTVNAFFKKSGYYYWDGDGSQQVMWVGYQTITCNVGAVTVSKRDVIFNATDFPETSELGETTSQLEIEPAVPVEPHLIPSESEAAKTEIKRRRHMHGSHRQHSRSLLSLPLSGSS